MSDDQRIPAPAPEERLRYAGATTRHEGSGEPRKTLTPVPADAIGDTDGIVLADAGEEAAIGSAEDGTA